LKSLFTSYVEEHQKNWDELLPYVLFAYRTSQHECTKEAPFFLMFGRDARLPSDMIMDTPSNILITQNISSYRAELVTRLNEAFNATRQQLQKAHEHRRNTMMRKEETFLPGTPVRLFTPPRVKKGLSKKLIKPGRGPYRIVKQVSRVTYEIKDENGRKLKQLVHQQRLKRYDIHTREEDLNEPELSQDDTFDMDKEESEDETFQSKKKHKKKKKKKKKRKTKEEKQPVENNSRWSAATNWPAKTKAADQR
jgi:hypothetical protein